MATQVTTNPIIQDGDSSIMDALVSCLNNSTDYLYSDDGIGEQVKYEAHDQPDGEALGKRVTATGRFSGPITIQKVHVSDSDPRPGYVVTFRGNYYAITGAIAPTKAKNKVVMLKLTVEQVINPLITTMLSTMGSVLTASGTAASYTLAAPTVVNMRNGATKSFTLTAWTEEYPSATVPTGLTISSSTGAITGTSVTAGTYYLKVSCQDTLAGQINRIGVAFLVLTLT